MSIFKRFRPSIEPPAFDIQQQLPFPVHPAEEYHESPEFQAMLPVRDPETGALHSPVLDALMLKLPMDRVDAANTDMLNSLIFDKAIESRSQLLLQRTMHLAQIADADKQRASALDALKAHKKRLDDLHTKILKQIKNLSARYLLDRWEVKSDDETETTPQLAP